VKRFYSDPTTTLKTELRGPRIIVADHERFVGRTDAWQEGTN